MTTVINMAKSEVLAIPSPEFTESWHPVSHGQVIQTLDNVLEDLGIPVINEHYTVINLGKRLFGSYTLDVANNGMRYELGFRNAIDKSMALGFVAGTNVMVCSNMCFSGEFIEVRKHTSGLTDDVLFALVRMAANGAIEKIAEVKTWHLGLLNHPVSVPNFKELTYDFMAAGVFPPAQFQSFLSCADEELVASQSKAHTLYSVHGGATRMMRTAGLHKIQRCSRALNGVIDSHLNHRLLTSS